MTVSALDEIIGALTATPAKERSKAARAAMEATAGFPWVPNPGPQTAAFFSPADELLYGGEAGGGKSDLLLGLALNAHRNSRILRRVNQDAGELGDRLCEILGSTTGYRSKPPTWRRGGKLIEMRGCEHEKDKQRYKGKPRDFLGYDELADFLESQYVFINTWNRSTIPGQRCRIVGATNGPTTAEGQWILKRWAAWLDPKHPRPAKDGELRWYLTVEGQDVEVDGPGPHELPGRGMVRATSRSFIRSKLSDNPDLARSDYASRLEGLPEELRRVYRDGDFTVGLKDGDYQVIPTAWVEAAMQRWTDRPPGRTAMSALALDVAPGGGDSRAIAYRYGGWFGPIAAAKQVDKTGRESAGEVVKHRRDNCPVIVDMGGGWGGDALIALKDNGIVVYSFNGVTKSNAKTRDGKLGFYNLRAESYWRLREELDPTQEGGSAIALPPDQELKGDLTAVHWKLTTRGILLEDKDVIKERLGRSPDKGDAVSMCTSEGNRAAARAIRAQQQGNRPTQSNVGYSDMKRRR